MASSLEKIKFSKKSTLVVVACLGLLVALIAWLLVTKGPKDPIESKPSIAEPIRLTPEAKSHVVQAAEAELEEFIKAPGMADFHPKHALRIHSAFPGVVTRVMKNLGDSVSVGDALATVESNIGIQIYTVSSPIKGTLLAKNISEGQSISPEEEIFSVGDSSLLQARLAIAARDAKNVKAGQDVYLLSENRLPVGSKILFLSPILAEETRTATAIVDISESSLLPGMFVTGAIVVGKRKVPVSLPLKFCHDEKLSAVIGLVSGDIAEKRQVFFGARDFTSCEVIRGLNAGDQVVDLSNPISSEPKEHDHDSEQAKKGKDASEASEPEVQDKEHDHDKH